MAPISLRDGDDLASHDECAAASRAGGRACVHGDLTAAGSLRAARDREPVDVAAYGPRAGAEAGGDLNRPSAAGRANRIVQRRNGERARRRLLGDTDVQYANLD